MVTEFNSRRSHFGARKGFIVNYTVLKKGFVRQQVAYHMTNHHVMSSYRKINARL